MNRRTIEAAIEQFEESWNSADTSNIERCIERFRSEFAGTAGDLDAACVELTNELVQIDLELRCGQGDTVALESYVRRFPLFQTEPDRLLELVNTEWRLSGKRTDVQVDLQSRFPSLADEIARFNEVDRRSLSVSIQIAKSDLVRCPRCGNSIRHSPAQETVCSSCGSTFSQDETRSISFTVGQRIGRFELIEIVGQGAFGTVYRARDPALQRDVAIKVPNFEFANFEQRERFVKEAQMVAQLSHPGIVPVFEVGTESGTPYLVSEFVAGRTLADVLRGQRMEHDQSASLVADLADALHYAHRRGVIHRDVKPRNVILDEIGDQAETLRPNRWRIRLLDFGLARWEQDEHHDATRLVGTPAYMSPEQAAQSEADERMDIYSLGVVLYEMLTLTTPFHGTPTMLIRQVIRDAPPPPRHLDEAIPETLELICLKCLEKRPAKRYASADLLAEELHAYLEGRAIAARPVSWPERAARWAYRHPVISTLATAAILFSVAGISTSSLLWLQADARARDEAVQRQRATDRAERERALRMQMNRQVYFAKMNQAQRAFEENNRLRVSELLQDCLPQSDNAEPDLRSLEWHYWHDQIQGFQRVIYEGDGQCRSLAISPEGDMLAICNSENDVMIWNRQSSRFTDSLQLGNSRALDAHWSQDGRKLAVGTNDRILVYDLDKQKIIWQHQIRLDYSTPVRLSNDGRHLYWSRSASGQLQCVDLDQLEIEVVADDLRRGYPVFELSPQDGVIVYSTGEDLVRLVPSTGEKQRFSRQADLRDSGTSLGTVYDLCFLAKGLQLAVATSTGQVELWDMEEQRVISTLQLTSNEPLETVAVSPDGKWLAAGGRDCRVHLVEASTRQTISSSLGHNDWIRAITFSANGDSLFSGSADGRVLEWKMEHLQAPASFQVANRLDTGCAHAESGTCFLAGDRIVLLSPSGRVLQQVGGPTSRYIAADCDSNHDRFIAATLVGRVDIRSFDAQSPAIELPRRLQAPDRGLLQLQLVSGTQQAVMSASLGKVKRIDLTSGDVLGDYSVTDARVAHIRVSPDGRWLWRATGDGYLDQIDLETGRVVQEIAIEIGPVTASRCANDGSRIAVACNRAIEIIDTHDQSARVTLRGHGGDVTRIEFTDDPRRILSGGKDGIIKWWDTEECQPVASFDLKSEIIHLRFETREQTIIAATRHGIVRRWNIASPLDASGTAEE